MFGANANAFARAPERSPGALPEAAPVRAPAAELGGGAAAEAVGDVYLTREELAARVMQLGTEIARDYAGREPLLVGTLKACVPFLADLSRALALPHTVDFVELAGYGRPNAPGQIRLLKDLDSGIAGRDVLVVEDVVDTGLTLRFLCRTLSLRGPASLAVVTLLDRPYRRLVADLPVRYTGFVVPDELFVGYGFDVDERFRALPDLHVYRGNA